MPDLFPTPTRLALLREVAAGNVMEGITEETDGHTWLVVEPDPPRKVCARIREMHEAGWVEQHEDAVSWQLADAGRAVLDANAEPASTVAKPAPYMVCPDCPHRVYFDDQAAGMDEMERHVQWRHPLTDRTPAVLWPRIRVVTGA